MQANENNTYSENNYEHFYMSQYFIKNNNNMPIRYKKHCKINNNILEYSINAINNIIIKNLNSTFNLNMLNNYNIPTINKSQNINNNIYTNSLCDLVDNKIRTELYKISLDQFINLYPNSYKYLRLKSMSLKKKMKILKISQENFIQINSEHKKNKIYSPSKITTKLNLNNNEIENNYNKTEIKNNKKLFIYRNKPSRNLQNNSEPKNKSKNIFCNINDQRDNSPNNKKTTKNNCYFNKYMILKNKIPSNIPKKKKDIYNTNNMQLNEKVNFIKKSNRTKILPIKKLMTNNYNSAQNSYNNIKTNKTIIHPTIIKQKKENKFKNKKTVKSINEDKETICTASFVDPASNVKNKDCNNDNNIFKVLDNTDIINQKCSFGSNLGTIGTNTNKETINSSKKCQNNFYEHENNNISNLDNNNFYEKINPYFDEKNEKEEENIIDSDDDNDLESFSFNNKNNFYH